MSTQPYRGFTPSVVAEPDPFPSMLNIVVEATVEGARIDKDGLHVEIREWDKERRGFVLYCTVVVDSKFEACVRPYLGKRVRFFMEPVE